MIQVKTTYRIISLTLALLMLSTSFSYSLNLHYCQNSLAGISLFETSTSCSKESKTSCSSKIKTETKDNKKNCCHNETVKIDVLDVDYTSSVAAEFVDVLIPLIAAPSAEPVIHNFIAEAIPYYSYKPPPLPDIGLQVLYQTFLI